MLSLIYIFGFPNDVKFCVVIFILKQQANEMVSALENKKT